MAETNDDKDNGIVFKQAVSIVKENVQEPPHLSTQKQKDQKEKAIRDSVCMHIACILKN